MIELETPPEIEEPAIPEPAKTIEEEIELPTVAEAPVEEPAPPVEEAIKEEAPKAEKTISTIADKLAATRETVADKLKSSKDTLADKISQQGKENKTLIERLADKEEKKRARLLHPKR